MSMHAFICTYVYIYTCMCILSQCIWLCMYVYIYTFILGEFHLIQGCPSMRMLKKNLTRVSQSQNQNSAWHVQILAPMLKAVLWLVTIVESRDLKDWVLFHMDFAKGLLGGKPYCSAYRIGLATLTVMIPLVARCPFNFMELHVSTFFLGWIIKLPCSVCEIRWWCEEWDKKCPRNMLCHEGISSKHIWSGSSSKVVSEWTCFLFVLSPLVHGRPMLLRWSPNFKFPSYPLRAPVYTRLQRSGEECVCVYT